MKTVAIIGNGRTRTSAPHDDPARDIWTMNNHVFLWQKRTTAVFEMHPDALVTSRYTEEYKDWLTFPHPFPIYMHNADARIPAAIAYPCIPMVPLLRGDRQVRNFYTTTTPYALALAEYMRYERVELYGIDLEKERQAHRDSVLFWIGYLVARGVEIYTPEECNLFDEALYPFTKGAQ